MLTQSANLIDPIPQRAVRDAADAASRGDWRARPISQALVNILRVERRMELHRAVAEAMTINETSFFRDGKAV